MNTTAEYLRFPPWEALVEMINQKHFVQLNPKVTQLAGLVALGDTLTEVTVKATRSAHPGNLLPAFTQGTYRYHRLNLGQYFQSLGIPLVVTGLRLPVSSWELVQWLQDITGVVFDLSDVLVERVTTVQQAQAVRLQAHPRSLRWVGELVLQVELPVMDLNTALTVTAVADALPYPQPESGTRAGQHLLMAFDFSAFRARLRALTVGGQQVPMRELLAILRLRSTLPWQATVSTGTLNLTDNLKLNEPQYRVLYNGPVHPRWTPRQDIQSVLVLNLNPSYCTDTSGFVTLHYN
jgi:hypothetical protein